MTLVVAFSKNRGPIVFGDLLTSVDGQGRPGPVQVPTAPEDVRHAAAASMPGREISELVQKVVLVSDRCVIAYAGCVATADSAIAELRREEEKRGRPLTREHFVGMWESFQRGKQETRAVFVGARAVDEQHFELFHWGGSRLTGGALASEGPACAAGTGVEFLPDIDAILMAAEETSGGDVNPVAQALAWTLSMEGFLLQVEMQSGVHAETLRNLFGGGYEVAHYTSTGFVKLDDICFLLWTAVVVDGAIRSLVPQFIFKQKYVGDWLLVRSAALQMRADGRSADAIGDRTFPIRPVGKMARGGRPTEPVSLESRRVLHVIMIGNGQLFEEMITRIQPDSSEAQPTIGEESTRHATTLRFPEDILTRAAQWVRYRGNRDADPATALMR
jgi:hypothetical protein